MTYMAYTPATQRRGMYLIFTCRPRVVESDFAFGPPAARRAAARIWNKDAGKFELMHTAQNEWAAIASFNRLSREHDVAVFKTDDPEHIPTVPMDYWTLRGMHNLVHVASYPPDRRSHV